MELEKLFLAKIQGMLFHSIVAQLWLAFAGGW